MLVKNLEIEKTETTLFTSILKVLHFVDLVYLISNSFINKISQGRKSVHEKKYLLIQIRLYWWYHLEIKPWFQMKPPLCKIKKGKGNRAAFLLTSQVKCEALCDWEMHFSVSNRWKGAVDCSDCCQERVCKIKGEGLLPAMFWALAQYIWGQ